MKKPKAKSSAESSSADNGTSSITTLRKALSLLGAIANAERPLTIAEASAAAKISRPTGYRIVQALMAESLLMQDSFGRLHVGFATLPLAAKVLDTTRLRAEAMPILQELSKNTGRRANLGILYRNRILHIAGAEKPSLPVLYARFGKIVPLHCSAMGKALIAYLPEDQVKAMIESQGMPALTPNTITSYKRLKQELADVRDKGFAWSNAEHVPGLYAVAAVVRGGGKPIASIGLLGRDLESVLATSALVIQAAEAVSHRIERTDD
jgi:DNA-binding IclR family transcriptional regulator